MRKILYYIILVHSIEPVKQAAAVFYRLFRIFCAPTPEAELNWTKQRIRQPNLQGILPTSLLRDLENILSGKPLCACRSDRGRGETIAVPRDGRLYPTAVLL